MRASFRLNLAGWGLEWDFGRLDGDDQPEKVVLSGGPIGFAAPDVDQVDDEDPSAGVSAPNRLPLEARNATSRS
ncbi:hypothetical protein [Micromonospora sp. NBC_01813]|uniref:hypothetical protein n=1 Tax=Micromonospora sp. NBC_01813 TaxID=2975988 RepID=UPI002DD7BDD8|nr:hypothetical protein [Micromonospora sp. NBC_01813]WSA11541.1 hypothetical protein OG958_12595 [Micromonospora sp. NBC_01813]